MTKEQAYIKIKQLVDRFNEQLPYYKKSDYNETQTRREFIDPFFKALGWDIDNEQGLAEIYKDVIHEYKLKIKDSTKAPDYCFTLSGQPKFFVEAKKPSIFIKEDIAPAYQVKRYGWNAKLSISIVTDFEEFAIYDCTKKPNVKDKTTTGRIKYLTFNEYLTEFDFLWETFARERVLRGSFDKFIKSDTIKKGTSTVDYDFLKSMEEWRKYLATNIAINNYSFEEEDINFVVQQTLDRIIFLRICEDRSIEPAGRLKATLTTKGTIYDQLFDYFKDADQKYNSGLFDFKKDKLSETVIIDNKVLKTIITDLEESPYLFNIIPVEILGYAYEQFLGKVIRITAGHRVKIEEKPEVRKAGGVFYTPKYIVDYIVQNTVGRIIDGKTAEQVSKIKILDPACGSGSFLLGAYEYLLKWHADYYNMKSKKTKQPQLTPEGNLTSTIKKQILINNIFGVDLDEQAVEVTKLSLLLKCLEGETKASITHQMTMFKERVLPNLDNNIKAGNSLVNDNYYNGEIDFEPNAERKIKPFNWQTTFNEVFAKGGFNVIIGNPPWVDLKGHPNELIKYYFSNYLTAENRINLYAIFLERAIQLLESTGKFGFIIPNSLLYQSSYQKLRKHILEKSKLQNIVRLPDNTFEGVKAESLIIIGNTKDEAVECLIYDRKDKISFINQDNAQQVRYVNQNKWLGNSFSAYDIFTDEQISNILNRLEDNTKPLIDFCDFTLGLTPYDKYKGHTEKQIKERTFHSSTAIDKTYKKLLSGGDITRYKVTWGEKEYISYGKWLGAPREKRFFTEPRILIRQIISGNPARIFAGYTDQELYNTQSVFNLVLKSDVDINIKFILAIINSKLMNFYHANKYLDQSKNLFQKILIQNCKQFPIPIIDTANKEQKTQHDKIVKQVENIETIQQSLTIAKNQNQTEQLQNRMQAEETRLDYMVYDLYNLTQIEIKAIK
jgi:type I restriction-modification system DNA methylase subunit